MHQLAVDENVSQLKILYCIFTTSKCGKSNGSTRWDHWEPLWGSKTWNTGYASGCHILQKKEHNIEKGADWVCTTITGEGILSSVARGNLGQRDTWLVHWHCAELPCCFTSKMLCPSLSLTHSLKNKQTNKQDYYLWGGQIGMICFLLLWHLVKGFSAHPR